MRTLSVCVSVCLSSRDYLLERRLRHFVSGVNQQVFVVQYIVGSDRMARKDDEHIVNYGLLATFSFKNKNLLRNWIFFF